MIPARVKLSVVATWLAASSTALAQQKPKLDEVLRSISESSRGDANSIDWTPFLLVIVACTFMYFAVKHWNRRQEKPKTLNNHARLIKEAAAAAGLSSRKLRTLESLAKAQGLSSPLVAMLCPSAITGLARTVKTDSERQALVDLAKEVLQP